MKLAILHLSDIHIKNEYNPIFKSIDSICESINILNNIAKVVIAITGDVTDTGSKEEYSIADKFIKSLKSRILKSHASVKSVEIIIVPGNHDIFIRNENPIETRDAIKAKFEDDRQLQSFLMMRRSLMENFYEFAEKYNSFRLNNFYDERIIDIDEKVKIVFKLINGVMLSTYRDNMGSQYFEYDWAHGNKKSALDIVLMHYPEEWFHETCKKVLKEKVLYCSDLLLMGHEHVGELSKTTIEDLYNFERIVGGQLVGDSSDKSYYAIEIDTEKTVENITIYNFSWNAKENFFKHKPYKAISIDLNRNSFNKFKLHPEFNAYFIEKDYFNNVENALLSDYYVIPTLEQERNEVDDKPKHLNSFDEILNCDSQCIIIKGKEEIGKTSLLKMLFKYSLDHNKYPIYIDLAETGNTKLDKALPDVFSEEYCNADYGKHEQLSKNERILLLDNVDIINRGQFIDNLKKAKEGFGKIVATSNERISLDLVERVKESQVIDTAEYKILPFFFEKRAELYNKIGNIIKASKFSSTITCQFDILDTLVTKNINIADITPSLLITLSIAYMENRYKADLNDKNIAFSILRLKLNELIESVNSRYLDEYNAVLSELAYYIHKTKKYPVPYLEACTVFDNYNKNYCGGKIDVKSTLNDFDAMNILSIRDNKVRFTTNRYLAYYIALKINNMFTAEKRMDEANDEVKKLYEYICFGINSEILLFISYINNTLNLLDNLLVELDLILTNHEPLDYDEIKLCLFDKSAKELLPDINIERAERKAYEKIKSEDEERNLTVYKNKEQAVDIYSYNENSINEIENIFIRCIKCFEMIGRTIGTLAHNIKTEDMKEYVTRVLELSNKFSNLMLTEIDSRFNSLILNSDEEFTDEEFDEIKEEVFGQSVLLNLNLLAHIGIYSANYKTIENFDIDIEKNKNVAHIFHSLIMDDVCINRLNYKKIDYLLKQTNSPVIRSALNVIIINYIYKNADDIDISEKNKIFGKYFSDHDEREKMNKRLILKDHPEFYKKDSDKNSQIES